MGHHSAIWTSDSNFLLAQIFFSGQPKASPHFRHCNAIEYFNKDMFLQMKRIRVIDLSYNRIKSLEPMFLMNVDGFLVNVDLSHNRLKTVDVTNIVWTKQKAFCKVNFSNNMISSINNSLNWACHRNSTFGYGGYVSFRNNSISQFINRTALVLVLSNTLEN